MGHFSFLALDFLHPDQFFCKKCINAVVGFAQTHPCCGCKSFICKGGCVDDTGNFKRKTRSNDTHGFRTDDEAKYFPIGIRVEPMQWATRLSKTGVAVLKMASKIIVRTILAR